MWLGEQITDRGIGNGMSLLIFTGIVVGLRAVSRTSSKRFAPMPGDPSPAWPSC